MDALKEWAGVVGPIVTALSFVFAVFLWRRGVRTQRLEQAGSIYCYRKTDNLRRFKLRNMSTAPIMEPYVCAHPPTPTQVFRRKYEATRRTRWRSVLKVKPWKVPDDSPRYAFLSGFSSSGARGEPCPTYVEPGQELQAVVWDKPDVNHFKLAAFVMFTDARGRRVAFDFETSKVREARWVHRHVRIFAPLHVELSPQYVKPGEASVTVP